MKNDIIRKLNDLRNSIGVLEAIKFNNDVNTPGNLQRLIDHQRKGWCWEDTFLIRLFRRKQPDSNECQPWITSTRSQIMDLLKQQILTSIKNDLPTYDNYDDDVKTQVTGILRSHRSNYTFATHKNGEETMTNSMKIYHDLIKGTFPVCKSA